MEKQHPDKDYLWDGHGEPDPELRALEDALKPLRHTPRALPQRALAKTAPKPTTPWRWVLLAAAVVLLAVGAWMAQTTQSPAPQPSPDMSEARAWPLERVLADASVEVSRLAVGHWITTQDGERAKLQVANIGTLDIEAGSRLRIRSTDQTAHRLELDYGAVHARVDAPPRLLVIESALGEVVDLGCEYVFALTREGTGYVHVHQGAVVIERAGKLPLFLPAGVRVESTAKRSPACRDIKEAPCGGHPAQLGLPFFDDADRGFVVAARAAAMQSDDFKRPHDSLTLWYLLERTSQESARRPLIRRLFELVPGLEGAVSEGDLSAPSPQHLTAAQNILEPFWLSL